MKKSRMHPSTMALIGLGVLALVLTSAVAGAYLSRNDVDQKDKVVATAPTKSGKIKWDNTAQRAAPQPQRVATRCDDGNIVGKVAGGVGGGALASNIGKGHGKTAATIAGTLGGAYVGGEVIPTRNVTCR